MGERSRIRIAGLAAAIHAAALLLPTAAPFNPNFCDTVYPGWDAYCGGWRAIIHFSPTELDGWILAAAGLANLLFLATIFSAFARHRLQCRYFALAGFLMCLPVLARYRGMIAFHPGYWVWLASFAVLAASSFPRSSGQTETCNASA